MVVARTAKKDRDAAVARVLSQPVASRELACKEEARRLRVAPRAMKRWVTEAQKGRANLIPPAEPTSSGPDLFGETQERDPSPDLERARKSAGIGDSGDDPDTPESGAAGGPVPAPSPKAVVAIANFARSSLLKLYAGVLRLDVTDRKVQQAVELSDSEKATLEEFAPYVATYFPDLLGGDDGKIGAISFAVVFVIGSWNAMGELKEFAKAERRKPPPPLINVPAVPVDGDGFEPPPREFTARRAPEDRPSGIPPIATGPGALSSIY